MLNLASSYDEWQLTSESGESKEKFTLSLRAAMPTDIDVMIEIQKNDGYNHAYYLTPERLQRLFDLGIDFYVVATQDDRVIAFIALEVEIRARLRFFSVHKDFQGRHLLNKEFLREAKIIYVYIEENGKKVKKFLGQYGFEEVGFYRNRFGEGKNSVILECKVNFLQ
jgi:hypothetical protein